MRKSLQLIALLAALPIGATSYYISNSGSDANAGTSEGSPWITLSNASYRTFAAGDFVLLKRGDRFAGPLYITNAGALGSPITLASYGSGAAPVVYGDHTNIVWSAATGYAGFFTNPPLSSISNPQLLYDASGTKYYDVGNRLSTPYATWLATFTNNCWGQDNQTRIFYIKPANSNAPTFMRMFDYRTVKLSGGYGVVRDLEITAGNNGITVSGAGNLISNNVLNNMLGISIEPTACWNSEVVSNHIYSCAYTMIYPIQPGGNNWFHYNRLETNTTTILGNVVAPAIELNGFGFLGQTNNLTEHNVVRWMDHNFFDFFYEANSEIRFNDCFHGGGGSPGGTGIKFHHNVMDCDGVGTGIIVAHYWSEENQIPEDTGPVVVYNNTVLNFRTAGPYSLTGSTGAMVFNNIFSTVTDYAGNSTAVYTNGVTSDYNLYYSTGVSPRWKWGTTNHSTLAAFFAVSGQDGHSIYTNAGLVGYVTPATSPAIRAGTNLITAGLVQSPQYDFAGRLIPGTWSIGAYDMLAGVQTLNIGGNLIFTP